MSATLRRYVIPSTAPLAAPEGVSCPACGAEPGAPCTFTLLAPLHAVHVARWRAALEPR